VFNDSNLAITKQMPGHYHRQPLQSFLQVFVLTIIMQKFILWF